MTNLAGELVKWANSAQDLAWSQFKAVTTHAAKFGLGAADVSRWGNPGEPAFVAHLVSDEANLFLHKAIAAQTVVPWRPDSVAVSSVFIHQKPKVDFGKGQIEIGDLLLVRQHFVFGRPIPQGSAFLLQAKTSNRPATGRLKNNEATQFELYRDWPAFTFPSYPDWLPQGSTNWDFSGMPQSDLTGLYGVVYPKEQRYMASPRRKLRFADDCAWGVGTRNEFGDSGGFGTVDASTQSLGGFMARFINGHAGRPWAVHRRDHWSQFVAQVMERAANEAWVYPIARLGISSRPRIQVGVPLAASLWFALQGAVLRPFGSEPRPEKLSAIRDWLESFDVRNLQYGGEDPPESDAEAVPPQRGGLSVVYVGTFGERLLEGLPTD